MAQRWPQALQLFLASERRCGPQLQRLTELLTALRLAPWRSSVHLLHRGQRQRLVPDVVCIGSLMATLERTTQWRQSLLRLRNMETSSLESNAVVLTAAFRALGRATRWRQAHALAARARWGALR